MTKPPIGDDRRTRSDRGWRHMLASTGYSLGGFRRLLREAAFRQEISSLVVVLALFAWFDVPARSHATQVVLFLILVSIEALNTAIEVLVDRISPDYAEFARQAKDLGSFAVFCLLAANAIHALAVLWTS